MEHHIKYMQLALELAEKAKGYTAPNPMVGCVIVKNDHIIGQGFHRQTGSNHAEINAINQAIANNLSSELKDATCYVTLEPCCHYGRTGPCSTALIAQGFKTVVVAMQDPNPLVAGKGIMLLKQAGIEVILGVCAAEAELLNQGFISRVTRNRPFIRSKIAASLDGSIALSNGESKWITNELARAEVHRWRLYSDAIVTTASTVNADNPLLTVRIPLTDLEYDYIKQPLRVVLDKYLMTEPTAHIYTHSTQQHSEQLNQTILITSHAAAEDPANADKIQQFIAQGVRIHYLPLVANNFVVTEVWELLAKLGCNDVLIEAGANFNGHLLGYNAQLDSRAVDEWIIYQSGLIMGEGAKNMFKINNQADTSSIANLFKLKCKHIKQIADNWCIILG